MKVTILEGYHESSTGLGSRRRSSTTKGSNQMKLATAARACKGKKKGAFRACIKKKMLADRRSKRR